MANTKHSDNSQKFLDIFGLSELTGLKVRTIRSLVSKRAISVIRVGWRTHLFQPEKVARSLEKFETKSVADRNGR